MPAMSDLLRDDGKKPAEAKATPRRPMLGFLADRLREGRDVANKIDLPLLGPLGDLYLGKTPEEVDEWSYGNAPMRINPLAGRTASYVPEMKPGRASNLFDTASTFAALPGAARKAATGAVLGGLTPSPGSLGGDVASYLPHVPSKPDPRVGTRFKREMVGDLAEKTPLKIEDLKDASLLGTPWDQSSRGQLITSVSDETLPHPVLTTGGQDFARDRANIAAGRGGASNEGIAKRVQDRTNVASRENLAAGGSGRVYMLPSTMGPDSEFFSTMPSEVLVQMLRNANLGKKDIDSLTQMVRNAPVQVPGKGLVRPFGQFGGFDDHDLLREQLLGGLGPGATAGQLRTALSEQLTKVGPQKMIGFNKEDMMAAIRDPALEGVPKGYMGNAVIEGVPGASVMDLSNHPAYNRGTRGDYKGTLGANIPIETMMPKAYASTLREMQNRTSDPRKLHNMTIGALERRKAGFSEKVDQQVIDSVNQYLEGLRRAP